MKYNIAVVDKDELYLGRMCRLFSERYADRITVYSYSNLGNYEDGKKINHFDLVLFAEGMIEPENIPQGTQAVYLVEQNDIDKIDEFPVICKFQKHEVLFKQIMDLCLEKEVIHYTKKNVLGNVTKVVLVTSPQGGVGTTTVATAVARNCAQKGKRVLYLSLEQNAVTDLFFQGGEEYTFSDVIYTIKSKKSNMISRVENIVQKDDSGVYFFRPSRTVFDMHELNGEDIEHLLKEICTMGSYEYIIVDTLLKFNTDGYFLCDYADNIIVVSGGGDVAEKKLEQFKSAIMIWDTQKATRFWTKSNLIYNKLVQNYGVQNQMVNYASGCIPMISGMSEKQMSEQIALMPIWDGMNI